MGKEEDKEKLEKFLKKQDVEEKLYQVYKQVFKETFVSCVSGLTKANPMMDLATQAFEVSKYEIAVKACREVLEKYEEGLYRMPDPNQTKMEFKDGQE